LSNEFLIHLMLMAQAAINLRLSHARQRGFGFLAQN